MDEINKNILTEIVENITEAANELKGEEGDLVFGELLAYAESLEIIKDAVAGYDIEKDIGLDYDIEKRYLGITINSGENINDR